VTRWVLGHADATRPASAVADALVAAIAPGRAALGRWLRGPEATARGAHRDALVAAGVPAAVADPLADAEWTASLLDVAEAAERGRLAPAEAGRRYFALAERIDFPWLLARCAEARSDARWDRQAVDGLVEDVLDARRRLVAVPTDTLPAKSLAVVDDVLRDLRMAPRVPLAALLVLVRELRRLADVVSDPLAHRGQDRPW